MHFFYLDESGDTGLDLNNPDQPVFVLGGISVKDTGWMTTQAAFTQLVDAYFDGETPANFELHAHELLAPDGGGPFEAHPRTRRNKLATDILGLIADRKHAIHLVAIDKTSLNTSDCDAPTTFDPKSPWLLAFDYLITYINWVVREKLGASARGMVIHDDKPEHQDQIERIAFERRFAGPKSQRVKWVVEFSYAVDSRRNPMIQISDVVTYCVRRFLEIENGHKPALADDAMSFYGHSYEAIASRIKRQTIVPRGTVALRPLDQHLAAVRSSARRGWKTRWT
jgi:hypothetical protein